MMTANTETKSELESLASALDAVRETEEQLKLQRRDLMKSAHEDGMTYSEIGKALGVTKAYVHQQVKLLNGNNNE